VAKELLDRADIRAVRQQTRRDIFRELRPAFAQLTSPIEEA
jgi:hypothetical protein